MAMVLADYEEKWRRFPHKRGEIRHETRYFIVPVDEVDDVYPTEGDAMTGSTSPSGYTVQSVKVGPHAEDGMVTLVVDYEYQKSVDDS